MNAIFNRLRRKPLRAILTLLQLVLGALAMTLALSAYLDARQRQTAALGDRFDLIAGWQEEGFGTFTPIMTENKLEELLELAPDVEKVALRAGVWNPMVEKDGKLYQFINGAYVNSAFFELNDVTLTNGSLFSSSDFESKAAVMLVSESAAKVLFPDQNPVGQTLNLMPDEFAREYDEQGNPLPLGPPEPFKVIGTFEEKNINDPNQFTHLYLPLWKQSSLMAGSDTMNVLAKAGRGNEAREQILTAARQAFKEQLAEQQAKEGRDFYIQNLGQEWGNKNSGKMIDPSVVMFGIFGIVALVVGSIGIFSIMLVDALERERDTGIKRALGATRARITREMTLEATLIAGLGGLIGVLLAAVIIPLLVQQVGNSLFWNVSLRWQPLAGGIVFTLTLLLGTVLGFFPALRASSVKPVEALKST